MITKEPVRISIFIQNIYYERICWTEFVQRHEQGIVAIVAMLHCCNCWNVTMLQLLQCSIVAIVAMLHCCNLLRLTWSVLQQSINSFWQLLWPCMSSRSLVILRFLHSKSRGGANHRADKGWSYRLVTCIFCAACWPWRTFWVDRGIIRVIQGIPIKQTTISCYSG